MKIAVINGPNLNLLGLREPELYGHLNYQSLCEKISEKAKELNLEVVHFQSNHEGELVDIIQKTYQKFDGILINPAAYTHTSIALLDALKAVALPCVEVHLTDISKREAFRQHSFVSLYANRTITGKGVEGYLEGLVFLKQMCGEKSETFI